jgi:hypothetical protein
MEREHRGLFSRIGAVFAGRMHASEPLNLKGVRWNRWVYFWAKVFGSKKRGCAKKF